SAVIVFIVSSIIHTLLTYHRTDFQSVPSEDQVQDALRPFNIPPGDYGLPYAGSMQALKSPEFLEKLNKGPVAFLTVLPTGPMNMGKSLAQWFVYSLIVSFFAAYLASRVVDAGTDYLAVFRVVGTVAFMGYSIGLMQNSIWLGRSWPATLRSMFDGLIYALFTAGTFGWLWPG
ncbi:MAG: hypothetical protein ACE5FJ_01595, partial [Gemmatimonadales bacterium]